MNDEHARFTDDGNPLPEPPFWDDGCRLGDAEVLLVPLWGDPVPELPGLPPDEPLPELPAPQTDIPVEGP